MSRIDQVRELLSQRDDVEEVQVQYTDGEVVELSVDTLGGRSVADQLESFISGIDWARVKEVEVGYTNEDEFELDFEELEDDDDDDDDEDDEEDNNDVRDFDDDEDEDDEDDEEEDLSSLDIGFEDDDDEEDDED